MSDLYTIFNFICWTMGQFFDVLDHAYLGSWSILSILCAIAFIETTLWFINRVINPGENEQNAEE